MYTYPAYRPPSHTAEWPEGTKGQEVVENSQGPGAQFQGRSGHTAQLAQPPPQGQLGKVQPVGHKPRSGAGVLTGTQKHPILTTAIPVPTLNKLPPVE